MIQFPSLMFVQRIPYQSVRRRRIRHWALLAHAVRGHPDDRRRVCPAVPPPAGHRGGRRRRQPRDRRPAGSLGEHGVRRSLAARARRRAPGDRSRSAPTTARRWCSSAATPRRACGRPPIAARLDAAIDNAKVDADATRYGPGAEAGREHPRPVAGPAPRGGAHQRLPARRLDRVGRRALPRGLHGHAGVGGLGRLEQRGHSVGHLRARLLLGPGARHRVGRHRQPGRRAGGRRAGDARGRRPPDRDAAREDRRQRHHIRRVHPVHRRQADREGHGPRRNRPAAGRQRLSLHHLADRTRVAPGRHQPGPPRFRALSLPGARHRHEPGVSHRHRAGDARDAGQFREAGGGDSERCQLSFGRRQQHAEEVRRSRRRPAGRGRRPARAGRKARPTCCPARWDRLSIGPRATARRSVSATTATPSSRSSKRPAAAISPPPASTAIAR